MARSPPRQDTLQLMGRHLSSFFVPVALVRAPGRSMPLQIDLDFYKVPKKPRHQATDLEFDGQS